MSAMRTIATRAVVVAGALFAALGATAVCAQKPGSRQTREFVQAAAQSDMFEILEATTALAESKDPAVRAFAQQMIEVHQRTTQDLLRAVAKTGLAPPKPGVNGDQSMFLAALQSQRGTDFDRTYVRQQVLAHRAALATEQGYAASGDDAAVRNVAGTAVPIIAAHLEMLERMQAKMGF